MDSVCDAISPQDPFLDDYLINAHQQKSAMRLAGAHEILWRRIC